MGEPAIEVSRLSKSYRGTPALAGIDLAVGPGEIFALLGPNGAGKTTLVEICEGYRRIDSGQVRVLGENPRRAGRGWRARVGIVSQRSDDLGELTVAEAIASVAGYYSDPRPVDELIDAVGLRAKRTSHCERLSGGQRRRLDVALGIVGRPELLFLDEPTTGFDPEARRELWSLVRELNSDGTTILLTTHYLDEAEYLAHRVGVIAAGRVLDVGTPQTIGGRDEAAARVRWMDATGPREAHTTEPTRLIGELSARFEGEIPQLVVERPSLEDVYVRMIERANVGRADEG